MKKQLIFWLVFLGLGVFAVWMAGDRLVFFEEMWDRECLKTYGNTYPDLTAVFGQTLIARLKLLLLAGLICSSRIRKVFPWLCLGALGLIQGGLAAGGYVCVGWKGLLLMPAALFPHVFIYLMACGLIYSGRYRYESETKKDRRGRIIRIVGICLLFLAGVFVETVLGTRLFRMVCRFV